MNRKHDPLAKFLISKHKDPYLFPALDIQITTAKYWIKNKEHLNFKNIMQNSSSNFSLKRKTDKLQEEARELKKQIRHILSNFTKYTPNQF
jgi:hypothetical protein